MALDPSIILQGRSPNILGAMAQGTQLRAARDEMQRGNALAALMQQHGSALASGDRNALGQLAASGYLQPEQVANLGSSFLGQEATRQGMAHADERLGMDRETMRLRIAEIAKSDQREALEREAAEAQRQAQGMMAAYMQGPEVFAQQGFDVPYERFPQMYAEVTGGLDVVAEVLADPDVTRIVSGEDAASLGLPADGAYNVTEGQGGVSATRIGGGDTNITTNIGGEEVPGDGKLRDELMKNEGQLWAAYLEKGAVSAGMAQDLEALGQIAQLAPQGPIAGRLAQMVPGASNAGAAFQSIVARVAPSLRTEGSGAQSDIEYQGFLASMPSLINYPEANRVIMAVLTAKAQVNTDRARVVNAYQAGQIDHVTARQQLQEIDSRSILTPEMQAAIEGIAGEAEAPANGLQMAPGASAEPPAANTGDLSDDDLLRMYGGQ